MRVIKGDKIVIEKLSIPDLLECHEPFYSNDHGVDIWTNLFTQGRQQGDEDCISVYTTWKGKDCTMPFHDATVTATFDCATIDQLMETFGINDVSGINAITPGQLFDLYLQGKAEIECKVYHLYDCYSLHFSLSPPSGFTSEAKGRNEVREGAEHTVALLLNTPDQFIQYTREYFRLHEIAVSEREKLECSVYYYLDEAELTFSNEWGVEFEYNGEGPGEKNYEHSLLISATWPSYANDNEEICLSVIYEGFDVGVLIDTFQITSTNGIKDITPLQLQKIFYDGKACVYCWLEEEDDGIFFWLQPNGSMMAAENYCGNNPSEVIYEISEPLETPEQFIDYTKRHFLFIRLFE